jgi:hypothetical protein
MWRHSWQNTRISHSDLFFSIMPPTLQVKAAPCHLVTSAVMSLARGTQAMPCIDSILHRIPGLYLGTVDATEYISQARRRMARGRLFAVSATEP